ncbi:rhomboid family protein [Fluviicola taffensis]|uniref:Rhomboid family protein n=1 Tax=Fluviicola taffensis (strain DSM 16823 / NCIMB 13979 / RW262) TaxID=755732 RepID=F2ID88_FLUTR|nr:rhomboid family intramembrane serine protease [Fluviicola taffensis]AEA45503.1 Rhomboid family protein [Fluviicola taffensis DSM 16823]
MQERSLSQELKYQFKYGGVHIKLIFINVLVFLTIILFDLIGKLTGDALLWEFLKEIIFSLQTDLKVLVYTPYGFVTSIFSHFEFFHLLFNMIFLYFIGGIFKQFFSDRRMVHVYVWGGIVGGIFEVIAHQVTNQYPVVIGASGSIMALFIAMAVYRPNIEVRLFGIIPVKLYIIALIYLGSEILQMTQIDGIAHFAHIGGALIGLLSVVNLNSSTNIINWSETMQQRIARFFTRKNKLKVKQGGATRPVKTDEQYNMEAKAKQEKINIILDKISKSGYESLTKAEKDFLFSQSNK